MVAKKKKASILDKATPVGELPQILSALFYGRAGSGKTTIASTFPGPILLLDIGEKGTDSVYDVKGLDVLKLEEWDEFEEVYWDLEGSKYKTVIVDAVHSLQDLAVIEAKKKNGKDEAAQTALRDYGIACGILKTWIFNYRDLVDQGINIVFIAHDRVTGGDDSEEDDGMLMPEVGPRLMPSVASTLTGAVNIVGNTFVRESLTRAKKAGEKSTRRVEYGMRLGPHSYYMTKVRSPKQHITPSFIVDPDYHKILDVIQGKVIPEKTVKKTIKKIIKKTRTPKKAK